MKPYEWILFDADDTLFHFDAHQGLQLMFSQYGVDFTLSDFHEYEKINKPLWVEYQNGSITVSELKELRFTTWASKLNVGANDLNSAFMTAMAEICKPLDGAKHLLDSLKGKAKLGIITNGFADLQQIRLERTGLKDHFDLLVISEDVGVAKPHPHIFEHALTLMGNPDREQVLMVGDNLHSDIVGGIQAGFDACWLNRYAAPIAEGIAPHHEVISLHELTDKLIKQYR